MAAVLSSYLIVKLPWWKQVAIGFSTEILHQKYEHAQESKRQAVSGMVVIPSCSLIV